MATLTIEQWAAWMQYGFSGPGGLGVQVYEDGTIKVVDEAAKAKAIKWLDTAAAICMAESHMDTNAKNASSSARGLWQIMTSVHAEKIKFWQAYVYGDLHMKKYPTIFHPAVNCSVAHDLYNERGWKPWEVYNTGAYKKYLGKGYGLRAWKIQSGVGLTQAQIQEKIEELRQEHLLAVDTAQLAGALVPGGVLLSNDLVSNPVDTVLAFLREAGVTIGVFLLGLILLILGMWFLISQTKLGESVKGLTKRLPGA